MLMKSLRHVIMLMGGSIELRGILALLTAFHLKR